MCITISKVEFELPQNRKFRGLQENLNFSPEFIFVDGQGWVLFKFPMGLIFADDTQIYENKFPRKLIQLK